MASTNGPLRRGNLFVPLTWPVSEESFEELLTGGPFRLERIVSTGQATQSGKWYDQQIDEWVVLLRGAATLRFDEPEETLDLLPGDWLLIPAHCRHRVEQTATDQPTVWLALHANECRE